MYRNNSAGLTAIITLVFFSAATNAEIYFCEDRAGVSIDQYGVATSDDERNDFEQQDWVVDTEKGWRRSDIPGFGGACQTNKGYVVCRATDIVFGEATLSIHPDGSNFSLVYVDYGLGALAFVGKCTKPQENSG